MWEAEDIACFWYESKEINEEKVIRERQENRAIPWMDLNLYRNPNRKSCEYLICH